MKRAQAVPEGNINPIEDVENPIEDVEDPLAGMEKVEKEDTKLGFPEEHVEPLRGLLFVGSLSKNFTYAGHDFLIETLTEGEVIRVGQLISNYKGTFSEAEARACFTVAACVKSVDGYSLVTDIEPKSSNLTERVRVVEKWYPAVVRYIYKMYLDLESAEFAVASSLKK